MSGRTLLVSSLVGLLLLSVGCGGDAGETPERPDASPSPQLATYTDDEWGFAFDYPADWRQGVAERSESSLTVVCFAQSTVGEMTEGEKYPRMVQVYVGKLPRAVSESESLALYEQFAAGGEAAFPALFKSASDFQFRSSSLGELAGRPCLVMDGTEADVFEPSKLRAHRRQYTVFHEDREYELVLFAFEYRWAQDEAELERIAESFVILE